MVGEMVAMGLEVLYMKLSLRDSVLSTLITEDLNSEILFF